MTELPRTAEQFIEDQTRKWKEELAKGRLIKMKDVGREGWEYWARKAWTFHIQHNYRVKVLVIERIEFDHSEGIRAHPWKGERGTVEYRIGYYTLGGYQGGKGRWLWGQYSPMIPKEDFGEMLHKARTDGTLTK
jgi:hypothetical protein